MSWTLMPKANRFSLISGSLKPPVFIFYACQVPRLIWFLSELIRSNRGFRIPPKHQVAFRVLWFYTCNKHMMTVHCITFSFWYVPLSFKIKSEVYLLNIFLAKQRYNEVSSKTPSVNEDHKWKVAYTSAYNKLLRCGFCTTMEQWSKHKYVRLSTVPSTSQVWLWNLIYLSIAAKPIIIQ